MVGVWFGCATGGCTAECTGVVGFEESPVAHVAVHSCVSLLPFFLAASPFISVPMLIRLVPVDSGSETALRKHPSSNTP